MGARSNSSSHCFWRIYEAEDFIDWIENNVDRVGVYEGDYYIDVPEGAV
jgi:hypothetical protein